GLGRGAVNIYVRRIIGMDREGGGIAKLSSDHAAQIRVDFANAVVCAGCGDAVAGGVRGVADEVIAFVDGEDKQCVGLVDAVRGEAIEELLKRQVVFDQLFAVASFTGPVGEVDAAG